jgi:predicted HAD superfamily Cof-like phosphohydrolase
MKMVLEMVREFHEKFGCETNHKLGPPSHKTQLLRIRLLTEETTELLVALGDQDLVEIADGLADLVYVVAGTALAYGIPLDRVFVEVHRSNMTKVWPDGLVHKREDGKVLKPPGYSPPNIAGVLASP